MDSTQMDPGDYESTLHLLGELRRLCRFEDLSPEDRIDAIDHALELAVGGPPEMARDFVQGILGET